MKRIELGVNIDHVATVRQARRGAEPSVLDAARVCQPAECTGLPCICVKTGVIFRIRTCLMCASIPACG
jgi:hypothetical protein